MLLVCVFLSALVRMFNSCSSLFSCWFTGDDGKFSINGGKIVTKASLDREINDSYTLVINVTDHGHPALQVSHLENIWLVLVSDVLSLYPTLCQDAKLGTKNDLCAKLKLQYAMVADVTFFATMTEDFIILYFQLLGLFSTHDKYN